MALQSRGLSKMDVLCRHTQVTAITGISEYIIVSSKSSWEECLIVIAVVHLPYPQRGALVQISINETKCLPT